MLAASLAIDGDATVAIAVNVMASVNRRSRADTTAVLLFLLFHIMRSVPDQH